MTIIVMIKTVLNNSPVLWATWVRLLAGTVVLVPMLLASPRRRELIRSLVKWRSFGYPLAAAIVGTYLAMMCWIGGMKYATVSVAAILGQMATIFTLVFARIFLGEPLTPARLTGAFAAAGGAIILLV